ncbi:MAG: sigma-54 dependent transcriptional regulator [Acidobacteria bacterium]|nr:sigma-54 dependent transcriptional regulator [Acidobacteriota bacterium]
MNRAIDASASKADPIEEGVNVLAVDDEPEVTQWFRLFLEPRGIHVRTAGDGRTAELLFGAFRPHIVFLDLMLPDTRGDLLLARMLELSPGTHIVIVSGHATVPTAVSMMKGGAFHVLEKPLSPDAILAVIEQAAATRHAVAEQEATSDISRLGRMMTRSQAMRQVFELVETAASAADVSVLVLGENGSGKELVASALHELSSRRAKPFVRINCAAIPAELLESELFGHRRGSFTGAHSDRQGLLELADGGSVLLDEIAEMSAALQAKLLRVLQDREVRPVGGVRPIKVDFRLICASNVEPRKAIAEGQLREDLYFRVNTITVRLPALRDRRIDIPLLAQHFLEHFAAEHGRVLGGFHEASMRALVRYDWPGNVRELEHAVERAVIVSKGRHVALSDLPETLRKPPTRRGAIAPSIPVGCTLEELERLAIRQTLELTNWNKRAAANILGIHRPTLYNKLRKYRLWRRSDRPRSSP